MLLYQTIRYQQLPVLLGQDHTLRQPPLNNRR